MGWRPMGVGDLLDAAFRGYRRFLVPCLAAYACFCLPYLILQSGLAAFSQGALLMPQSVRVLVAAFSVPLAILVTTLFGLAEAVCACAVLLNLRGEPVTVRTAFAGLHGRWARLIWLTLLKTLRIGLGCLFCVVPGIILAINYALAIPVAVAEDSRGSAALRRSRAMVEDVKGKTFGLLVVMWLIETVFTLALVFAVYGSLAVASGRLESVLLGFSRSQGWGNVIVEAGARLLLPVSGLLWAYYYVDLRARREGFDLVTEVDRLVSPGDSMPIQA